MPLCGAGADAKHQECNRHWDERPAAAIEAQHQQHARCDEEEPVIAFRHV